MNEGDYIGEWVVERRIGGGGQATVFACRHGRIPDRRAAVKVVRPGPSGGLSPDVLARFRREVASLQWLSERHAGLPRVFGWGEDLGGLWLAQELLVGETLSTVLGRRGRFSPDEAKKVLRQVASALAACHANALIHRDLKPANIFLCEDGRVVLLDLGIVHVDGGEDLTGSGLIGSEGYLAPERFEGVETSAGDLFSLGVILWQMLTGRTAKARSGAKDPGMECPDDLRELCEALLERDPKLRPTAKEVEGWTWSFRKECSTTTRGAEKGAEPAGGDAIAPSASVPPQNARTSRAPMGAARRVALASIGTITLLTPGIAFLWKFGGELLQIFVGVTALIQFFSPEEEHSRPPPPPHPVPVEVSEELEATTHVGGTGASGGSSGSSAGSRERHTLTGEEPVPSTGQEDTPVPARVSEMTMEERDAHSRHHAELDAALARGDREATAQVLDEGESLNQMPVHDNIQAASILSVRGEPTSCADFRIWEPSTYTSAQGAELRSRWCTKCKAEYADYDDIDAMDCAARAGYFWDADGGRCRHRFNQFCMN